MQKVAPVFGRGLPNLWVWHSFETQLIDQLFQEHGDAVIALGLRRLWSAPGRRLRPAPADDFLLVDGHKLNQHDHPSYEDGRLERCSKTHSQFGIRDRSSSRIKRWNGA